MIRFTIRELVLVTVIVALGLGWWLNRSHLNVDRRRADYRTRQANDTVWVLKYELKHGSPPPYLEWPESIRPL